jgi:hypothetical protein
VQKSLDEVDPKLLETFDKLGIPINEQKRLAGVKDVAYDYVFDSESIATTFKKELAAQGIIFCSISEAVREYPDLVKKHLGSVVSRTRPLPLYALWLHIRGHSGLSRACCKALWQRSESPCFGSWARGHPGLHQEATFGPPSLLWHSCGGGWP